MAQEKRIVLLYAEESLHAGAGQSTGTIDQPIQRERHTNIPKIEGSAFRGAVRENAWQMTTNKAEFVRVFGNKDNGDNHSAIDFSDAHLLFFPVRSWKGVWTWLTSPMLLQKFAKDYLRVSSNTIFKLDLFENSLDNNTVVVQKNSALVMDNKKVLFEEYLFSAKEEDIKIGGKLIGEWIIDAFGGNDNVHDIIKRLNGQIALVNDTLFRDFTELYTHKITRNKIDSTTGTAEGGALFNEEFLPSESILYSTLVANSEFTKNETCLSEKEVMTNVVANFPRLIKAGGDQGIGKGLLRRSDFI